MSSSAGIQAVGYYLPRLRIARELIAQQLGWFDQTLNSRAKGNRRLANWDEDAITMAVAAARNVLPNSEQVSSLVFASTTAPFLDRSNGTLIAEALSLPREVNVLESSGSLRAGTSALLKELQNVGSAQALVVASDRRSATPGSLAEMTYGDAAAAVVVGAGVGEGIASFLGGCSIADDFIDHYRTHEHPQDYALEDRWVRDAGAAKLVPEAIETVAKSSGIEMSKINRLLLPLPTHHAKVVAKKLAINTDALEDNLYDQVGDTGTGHSLLMLASALESAKPGEIICLVGFGQGCDALLFEATKAIEKFKVEPSLADAKQKGPLVEQYIKLPAFSRQIELATGIRAEADKRTSMSAYHRNHRAINSMLGSVCESCQTPHFPPARVCVSCGATDQMADYPFADRAGRLKSFTEDWQAATPAPPLCYGNVEFEGGGNAFLELTDIEPGSLKVGTQLRMQFRIRNFDSLRGFRRYFWKPTPGGDRG